MESAAILSSASKPATSWPAEQQREKDRKPDQRRSLNSTILAYMLLVIMLGPSQADAYEKRAFCACFGGEGVNLQSTPDAALASSNHRHISSGFGWRIHPILKVLAFHHGIDIPAAPGTPIYSLASGIVERAGQNGGYGLFVRVRHGRNCATAYAHLSRIDVRSGQRVPRGGLLGAVGSTGLSTGPHLHLEITMNGIPVDPAQLCSTVSAIPQKSQTKHHPRANGALKRHIARRLSKSSSTHKEGL